MAPTLFTLTGNLLAETTLDFVTWAPGKTQRAHTDSFQVGGKGINVSRMLARLQAPQCALAFAGGHSGAACAEWLKKSGLRHQLFPQVAPTRSGTVIRASGQAETTFLSPDVPVEASAVSACCAFLRAQPAPLALALCGSFPGWASADVEPLRTLLSGCAQQGSLFVDTYGPPLSWAVSQPTALIKVNRDEFDLLFSAEERSLPLAERLSRARHRWPVAAWVITDGPREVLVLEGNQPLVRLQPPVVNEISATGSGDVFFAALLFGRLHLSLSWAQAAAYALPFGAANAAHPGIAEFDLNLIPNFRSQTP